MTYTSAPLRGAVKHPPNNSLKLGKKVNSKPSEMGRSPLTRLANRPIILRSSAYFESYSFYIFRVFFLLRFVLGGVFLRRPFFMLQNSFFTPFRVGLYSLKTSKKPYKTYSNPFTLFTASVVGCNRVKNRQKIFQTGQKLSGLSFRMPIVIWKSDLPVQKFLRFFQIKFSKSQKSCEFEVYTQSKNKKE